MASHFKAIATCGLLAGALAFTAVGCDLGAREEVGEGIGEEGYGAEGLEEEEGLGEEGLGEEEVEVD